MLGHYTRGLCPTKNVLRIYKNTGLLPIYGFKHAYLAFELKNKTKQNKKKKPEMLTSIVIFSKSVNTIIHKQGLFHFRLLVKCN